MWHFEYQIECVQKKQSHASSNNYKLSCVHTSIEQQDHGANKFGLYEHMLLVDIKSPAVRILDTIISSVHNQL